MLHDAYIYIINIVSKMLFVVIIIVLVIIITTSINYVLKRRRLYMDTIITKQYLVI